VELHRARRRRSNEQPRGARDPTRRLWRKTSTGTQTPEGDRFVERILSIRATCRCQNRPMHPYLVEVHKARLSGAPIPTPLTAKQDPQLTGT
jgi:transposase